MTIPYESVLDEDERSLASAFFRVLPVDEDTYVAALLLIDGSGEPLEFTYNRASVRRRLLWRDEDLQLAMTRELLTSLLETCPRDPSVLFCLAAETEARLFVEEIDIKRPVARVAAEGMAAPVAAIEERERFDGPEVVQLLWVRGRPGEETYAHRLVKRLAARGLLLEPFERVIVGLREAYELAVETGDGSGD